MTARSTLRPGILAGLALAALIAAQHFVDVPDGGPAPDLAHLAAHALWWWGMWGLLVPIVASTIARFPLTPPVAARSILAHAALLTVLVAARLAGYDLLGEPNVFTVASLLAKGASDVVTYAMIATVLTLLALSERERARQVEAARLAAAVGRLEGDLATAQLDALRFQLRPHFLFNALQGASTLMQRDPAAAEELLARLADLLRMALAPGRQQTVELREELEVARLYVGICLTRFGDRLRYTEDVDRAALSASVPFFLLQPLLENAIEHGIERQGGEGTITLRARRDATELVLSVEDGGGSRRDPPAFGAPGIGLANSRDRLKRLFGDAASLELRSGPDGGTIAEARVPAVTPR